MTLKVFLVEDLKPMHGLMTELLAAVGGFEVVGIAPTEAEAKHWLSEHRDQWDVLVVDLVLDQGSGIEVVRHARGRGQGKVVVFSGYVSPGVRHTCIESGADQVFDKAQSEDFLHWLDSLAGAKRPGRRH